MELNELFGLPAHPLVVHAAVVLLPIAALATMLTAILPRARKSYAIIAFVVALTATTAVGLAQGSGESLKDRVDETNLVEQHTEQGERVLPWAIALTVTSAAVAASGLLHRRYPKLTASRVTAVLAIAAIITGVGATWTVVEVGHSGAAATWDDLPTGGG